MVIKFVATIIYSRGILLRQHSFSNTSHFHRTIKTMANENIAKMFEKIVKPEEDKREYQGLVLENGLKALLISDKETDISAASLSVHVGSMSDPRDCLGIAHFLEHMLFMGTGKFPLENEYSKYLSQHGGSSNAYTDQTHTNYFFDIDPKYFEPGLDRFSQFFIDPLMLETSVNREIEAVNSEYQKNVDQDSWRIEQVLQTIANSEHDYSKFNIGNLETLRDAPAAKGVNIRDALLEFYKNHYSANLMCLVVLGKESIDELKRMVVNMFSPIKNNKFNHRVYTEHPFDENCLQKVVKIVPVKNQRTLRLVFQFPDDTELYKTSPGLYLSHLLGYEGKHSLFSELKRKGLCTSLYTDTDARDGFGFFNIGIELTPEGLDKVDDVLECIFAYVKLLNKEGPKEYIFEESKRLGYIRFNFKEKINPINYVYDLAAKMQVYPLDDILSVGQLLDEFKPELISKCQEFFKVEKCLVTLISKSFEGKTDKKEKYYGTDYMIEPMSQSLIEKLKNPGPNENLKLPEPNEFIPTDFKLFADDSDNKIPKLIKLSDHLKIWHLNDKVYLKPKVFFGIKFTNPVVSSTPSNNVALSMFVRLFNDALNEFLYDASLAGLKFNIGSYNFGFTLDFFGYNHKMSLFAKRLLEKFKDIKFDPKRFDILKEKMIRDLKNYKTGNLWGLTDYYLMLAMVTDNYSYENLIESLEVLTIDRVYSFMEHFLLANFNVEAIFHGNVDKEGAQAMIQVLQDFVQLIGAKPLAKSTNTNVRVVRMEPGDNYRLETIIDEQRPMAIRNYFQICFDDIEGLTKITLLNQILSEEFFDVLRTKEQLGYITYNTTQKLYGVYGISFVIQSQFATSYLDSRIEAFLVYAQNYIAKMSEEDFAKEKNSLSVQLMKKEKQLYTLAHRFYQQMLSGRYWFEEKEHIVKQLESITKNDILDFFKEHFSLESPTRKKLSIRINKSDPALNVLEPEKNGDVETLPAPVTKESLPVEDWVEFKKGFCLFPVPKPKTKLVVE